MKTITLTVKVSVPDNYQVEEPQWLLEDAIQCENDTEIESCYIVE